MEEQNSEKINKLIIPLSIIITGIVIAGAVYFSADKSVAPSTTNNAPVNQQPSQGSTASLDQMAAILASDHIRGNKDALVKIVEY